MSPVRILLALMALWSWPLAPASLAQAARYPGARFDFGGSVGDVAVADVDADGWPDLIAAAGDLRVRKGNGDGSFGPVITYPTSSEGKSVVAGDFDLDGDVDAVIAEWSVGALPESLLYFRGKPDGTFASPKSFPPNGFPIQLVAADMNGDGQSDLLVLQSGISGPPFTLTVWLGGHGTIGSPTPYLLPAEDSMAVGDLDADGALDVVVTGHDIDVVFVLRGVGDGTLLPAVSVPAGSKPEPICVADFDADGALDLAVGTSEPGGAVSVLLGHGDLTFEPPQVHGVGYVECGSVAAADLDRDGSLDLLATSGSRMCVFRGHGDGSFDPVVQHELGGSAHSTIAVTDFDRDGALDVAVNNWGDMDVTALMGDGTGGFIAAPLHDGPSVFERGAAVADFDVDGDLDLFATNEWENTGSTWLGDGEGDFALASTLGIADETWWVGAGQLDGDADPDLLLIDQTTATAQVLLGVGDGSFVPGQVVATGGTVPIEAALGDLDGDGDLDAAIVDNGLDRVMVLLGNGDGTFAPPTGPWTVQGSSANHIALGDVTGDGHLDAIVTSFSGSLNYTLLPGVGDGSFGPPSYFEPGTSASDVALDDLDGNGWLDVIIAHYSSETVTVSLHTGNPATPYQNFGVPYATLPQETGGPGTLQVGDFDGDGARDVAVGVGSAQRIELMFGDGLGHLTAREAYSVDETGNLIRAGDWNGDGALDLLAVAQKISVLLNRQTLTWKSFGGGLAGTDGIPHLHGEARWSAERPCRSSSSTRGRSRPRCCSPGSTSGCCPSRVAGSSLLPT
jgi:hypothetical protein